MYSLQLFLLVTFVTLSGSRVVFQDCGSAYELTMVSIDGCEARPPCFVTLGDAVPVKIEFIAGFESQEIDQDVVININLINLRPEVTPERCETAQCRIVTNAVSSFTSVMSVPQNMALNQRGWLRWRVYNESGQQVLCYSVLVQTQNSLQKRIRRDRRERRDRWQQLNNTAY